jgi:preprotein translocase subunit SecD
MIKAHKKLLSNKKLWILLIAILASIIFINPTFDEGVVIRSVASDSAAFDARPTPIPSPEAGIKPRAREQILQVNGVDINTVQEYISLTQNLAPNTTVSITTNKETYFLTTRPIYDNETNEVIEIQNLGIGVEEKASNNIRQGLDISGGTRVLIEPQGEITQEQLDIIITNIGQRLNVFGVGDVTVRSSRDLFGAPFIVVEIGGFTGDEITTLLSQQGVFEAKIGNETVFRGGEQDVLFVCRTADCAGIEPGSCRQISDSEHVCGYRFSITISSAAASRFADSTRNLAIMSDGGGRYLSENITLFLDGDEFSSLRIAGDLRGNAVTDISVSGSGSGASRSAATEDAIAGMRQLQTVLVTGSLPVELKIVKVDSISPAVGGGFVKNALLAGFLAIVSVILVVSIRYRTPKIIIPMSLTMLSEVLIIMGVAALINWNIDMAAIAAIIIAVGSGVDHQIVIVEETLNRAKGRNKYLSWEKKLAKAFFIIMAAYLTLVVALLPLWFAGAGMLRGFALTTIIGVSIGVLITRPAFAAMMQVILEKEE